jgi:hypothetical protein
MLAIFNRACDLVGWLEIQGNTSYIFDQDWNWIAFADGSAVFSTNTSHWIGAFVKNTFVDKQGRPIAWVEGCEPVPSFAPMKPMSPEIPRKLKHISKPSAPAKPASPALALHEWSQLQWSTWLNQLN